MSMRMEKSEQEALKGNFSTWKSREASVCVRCRRTIERGDTTRVEIFYDDFGKFQAVTHHDCREVSYRARLIIPRERTFVELSGGTRRLIMSAQTEATEQDVTTTATESKAKAKGTAKKSGKKSATKKGGKKSTTKTTAKEDTVAKTKTKRKGKKGAAKKAASKDPAREGTGSMAVTVAQRLKPHLGKNKKVSKILKAMANGDEVSHRNLEVLRDEVKEVAAKFRESGKLTQASELSSTNQLVRRLERAAR